MALDYEEVEKYIQFQLKVYAKEAGLKSLVIGISGGIDSALCAALAEPICSNAYNFPLIGVSIPIATNKQDEIDRATQVGNAFCDEFTEVDLSNVYHGLRVGFGMEDDGSLESRIRHGNIKARIRMMYLYDIAQKNHGMVLSTDNFTELMLGFWTLHGDVGDYGMVQNLWKTEVYEMAEYIAEIYHTMNAPGSGQKYWALKNCIDATPTDGLGVTSSDLEQLGADSYKEVDDILKEYLDLCYLAQHQGIIQDAKVEARFKDRQREMEQHPVIQRHLRTEYKRSNPYNIPRSVFE